MSRLTLRLPETLHQQLTGLAEREGVSLNQYIVYALTRQTAGYVVVPAAESPQQQEEDFQVLIRQLKQGSSGAIESSLVSRDVVEPEPELTPEVVERVRLMIAAKGNKNEGG
ncbi:MAG: toxin-antitoxin system HicB family antitoxin [Synechococcales cyanobacterium RU_4_20]|nr:toxin-antitoxin system HicB family antitoxin [Synechococcales cyanobacterium RU_4_20]NJR71194.1 toxin-antitoxin system HicB family antitoxin [Synechococcales cyanobacterium CRU_2_2]